MLGVLISTALLASGPIVVNTVVNFALPYKLRSTIADNGIIYLNAYSNLGAAANNELDSKVHESLQSNIIGLDPILHTKASPWLFPWEDGLLVTDERINLRYYSGIREKIHFIDGTWPGISNSENGIVHAAISKQMATVYSLKTGDLLGVSIRNNEAEPSFFIQISGIYQARDASDTFWLIQNNPFQSNNSRYLSEFGLILPEENFIFQTELLFPSSNVQLSWLGIIQPHSVNRGTTSEIIRGIDSVKLELNRFEYKVSLETNLDNFLEEFDVQASSIIPPIYLMIGEVVFLGLYFVLMVAALSIRQVEGELSTLTSRGANFRQLLGFQIFDALLICTAALIAGPILAYGFVFGLEKIGPLAEINQSDWIIRIPSASWLAAGICVLACFTALLIPIVPILRSSVILYKQKIARRKTLPWWQRYYLDLMILAVGLIATWRLSLYGSISGITLGKIDWLLLLAPLLLLIGSAAVFLRLAPIIFNAIAYAVARGRGVTTALALWQTARDPVHVIRLILLLTLTMALGVLSTGLNATLNLSESERARYATGGEARISFDNFISPSQVESLPQVTHTSAVWRGDGRANVRTYRNIPDFSILAIEPLSFATVAQFRPDYSDDYIGFVLGQLLVDPNQLPVSTIPLPGEPSHFGVWMVNPFPARTEVDIMEYVLMRAKIQTAEAETSIVDLKLVPNSKGTVNGNDEDADIIGESLPGSLPDLQETTDGLQSENSLLPQEPTWRYFEAELPDYNEYAYPLSLHSVWIRMRRIPADLGEFSSSQGPLIIDDLSTRDATGIQQVFEDFEELNTIWQTDSNLTLASYTKHDVAHSGEASMRLFIGQPDSSAWMVLSPAQTKKINALPILSSPAFLEMTGLKEGDTFAAFINGISILLEIKNTVNYFPTMYELENKGFVVVARDALLVELNRTSRNPVNFNEIWLRVDETQALPGLLDSFPDAMRTWELGAEKLLIKSDPLTLGLRSVIFLAYALTLVLSLVGFITYFYLSAIRRKSIFGILRSFGLSTTQLYSALIIEQLVVILSGLAIGIALGGLLNRMILPGLPVSFADVPAIPPFIPQADWLSVFNLISIIITGLAISLAIGGALLMRLNLHQVMRTGEE